MKLNILQKLLLTLYSLAFIFFSMIHVPFKIKGSDEIEYHSLFSNKSNLDITRLEFIIFTLSILSIVLFFLLKNISYKNQLKLKPLTYRRSIIVGVVSLIIVASISASFYWIYNKPRTYLGVAQDSTTVDSITETIDQPLKDNRPKFILEEVKLSDCTIENALEQFNNHMSFNYPDWKIYGKPVVQENDNCVFQIRFTTKNPHYGGYTEKEVIVVQVSFNNDFSQYFFKNIRGKIY